MSDVKPVREATAYGRWPCADDPDRWFSDQPSEVEAAKRICQPCPVRHTCLAAAIARGEPCGVWGGQLLDHGRVLPRKRGRGRPPKIRPAA